MSKYRNLSNDLQSELSRLNQDREGNLTDLGAALTSLKKVSTEEPSLLDALGTARDLRKQLGAKQTTVDLWHRIERELQESKSVQKELEERRGSARSELENYFEDIGGAAFQLYSTSPGVFERSAAVLNDMHDLENRIKAKEKELRLLEAGPGSSTFIGKTVRKGKGLVLRGSLKTRELQRGKQLRLIGQHLCELDEMPELPGGSELSALVGPLQGTISSLKMAETELETLMKQRSSLEQERVAIEKGARMRNPLRNLEHQVSQFEHDLSSQYNLIGHLYDEFGTESPAGKAGKIVSELNRNDLEKEKLEKLLVRVKAAIEVEDLELQLTSLEEEQESLRTRVGELEIDQKKIAAEITKKAKLRGSVAGLKLPAKPNGEDVETDK